METQKKKEKQKIEKHKKKRRKEGHLDPSLGTVTNGPTTRPSNQRRLKKSARQCQPLAGDRPTRPTLWPSYHAWPRQEQTRRPGQRFAHQASPADPSSAGQNSANDGQHVNRYGKLHRHGRSVCHGVHLTHEPFRLSQQPATPSNTWPSIARPHHPFGQVPQLPRHPFTLSDTTNLILFVAIMKKPRSTLSEVCFYLFCFVNTIGGFRFLFQGRCKQRLISWNSTILIRVRPMLNKERYHPVSHQTKVTLFLTYLSHGFIPMLTFTPGTV